MNSEHYRIAQLCRKEMMSDPGKLTPRAFEIIRQIISYKNKPIMSWHLLYLKSIARALGFPGMEDYKPPNNISGVEIAYMLNAEEMHSLVPKGSASYKNAYQADEAKFVDTFKGKHTHAIAYLDTMWFFTPDKKDVKDDEYAVVMQEKPPENQDNSLLTKENE